MNTKRIGVGLVGLKPDEGWGRHAHWPALRSLERYDVAGVANSNLVSAEHAAQSLGVPRAFPDAAALARDEAVDLVAVTVKVPHHHDLVRTALGAGKMVYCEWPLGNGLAEAVDMAEAAEQAGVRTVVGLQARSSPVIRHLRDLLRDGYVGEVLSTTMMGSGGSWGAQENARNAYLRDRRNGADLLSIPFGHAIDALRHCLGEFVDVNAVTAMRRHSFTIVETGARQEAATDDQIVVSGHLRGGAVAALHYRGGRSRATNLRWEINGTEGDLVVTGGSGHLQMADLDLQGARGDERLAPIATPDRYRLSAPDLTGPAVNVAEAYIQFANGADTGFPVPDFAEAVTLHRLLDAVARSARDAVRVTL